MPIRQLRVKKELDWKGGRVREVLETIGRDRAGEGAAIPPSISVTPLQELRRTDSTPKKIKSFAAPVSQKSFPEPQMSRERAKHPSPSSRHDFHPKLDVGQQTPSYPRSESSSFADLGHPGTRRVFPAAVWGLLFPCLSFFFLFFPKPDSSPAALSRVEKHKHPGGSQRQRCTRTEPRGNGAGLVPFSCPELPDTEKATRNRDVATRNRDVATREPRGSVLLLPRARLWIWGCGAGAGMSQDVPVGFSQGCVVQFGPDLSLSTPWECFLLLKIKKKF